MGMRFVPDEFDGLRMPMRFRRPMRSRSVLVSLVERELGCVVHAYRLVTVCF